MGGGRNESRIPVIVTMTPSHDISSFLVGRDGPLPLRCVGNDITHKLGKKRRGDSELVQWQ